MKYIKTGIVWLGIGGCLTHGVDGQSLYRCAMQRDTVYALAGTATRVGVNIIKHRVDVTDVIHHIARGPKGTIFAGGKAGLFQQVGKSWQKIDLRDGAFNGRITGLTQAKEGLYVVGSFTKVAGTDIANVALFDGQRFQSVDGFSFSPRQVFELGGRKIAQSSDYQLYQKSEAKWRPIGEKGIRYRPQFVSGRSLWVVADTNHERRRTPYVWKQKSWRRLDSFINKKPRCPLNYESQLFQHGGGIYLSNPSKTCRFLYKLKGDLWQEVFASGDFLKQLYTSGRTIHHRHRFRRIGDFLYGFGFTTSAKSDRTLHNLERYPLTGLRCH